MTGPEHTARRVEAVAKTLGRAAAAGGIQCCGAMRVATGPGMRDVPRWL